MKYIKDKIVIGTVSGITDYGAFIKFDDYYSGLIHISEMSDKFVNNINDFVKVGERIRVKIIDVDDETCHLKLTIKNINYRNIEKSKNTKIVETKHGFMTLEKNLNFWVNEYLKSKKISKYY